MPAPAKAGGYRGHNQPHKFRVWISGQIHRVTASIRREMKRHAAVDPIIGHLMADSRMGRNHLRGPEGGRIDAVLAAAGYNLYGAARVNWFDRLISPLGVLRPFGSQAVTDRSQRIRR